MQNGEPKGRVKAKQARRIACQCDPAVDNWTSFKQALALAMGEVSAQMKEVGNAEARPTKLPVALATRATREDVPRVGTRSRGEE